MHKTSTTNRHILIVCLLLLTAFLFAQTASVNTVAAEPLTYSCSIIETDDYFTLVWDAYVGTFDYYVVTLNGDVLVDGYEFAYLDVTESIAVGGEYEFAINVSSDGDLTQIATTEITRNVNLQKVKDVQIKNGLATWNHIVGATDYDVFINGIKVANIASTSICIADYVGKSGEYTLQILPKHGENSYYSTEIPLSFDFEHTEYAVFDGYPVYFALYDSLTISLENCADNYLYVISDGENCVLEQETADNFITFTYDSDTIYNLYASAVYDTHVQLLNTIQFSITNGAVKIYD